MPKHKEKVPKDELIELKKQGKKALEQGPCDKYIKEIDHLRKYISKLETQIIEQESCVDCISRQAVISTIYDNKSDFKNDFAQGFFADRIRDLPTVTPQPENARINARKRTRADCISRRALKDLGAECIAKRDENGNLIPLGSIDSLPTVTQQPELVRCGQCKYAEVADSEDSQDGYTCKFHRGSIWFSGSYCSWAKKAERREDDD